MRIRMTCPLCCLCILGTLLSSVAVAKTTPWTVEEATAWYAQQEWIVGANYAPSTAINQLEMWQKETFDPVTIDRELGWAAAAGFNSMRVFLHDLVWADDPEAYYVRIDEYLTIASTHGISTMLVLFDSVWDPHPKLGKQREPKPGVHNSGWVQGPHIDVLKDEARHDEMKPYVQGIVKRFGRDKRVLIWDLYNEPGNTNGASYGALEPPNKEQLCRVFLEKIFRWVRAADPMQPLTVAAWRGVGAKGEPLLPLGQYMLDHSDIVSFHTYDHKERAGHAADRAKATGRPSICTEYMSRRTGSTFQEILPLFKKSGIGAYNWGLVNGKSQTIYPWETWQKPYDAEPDIWFHDVFRADGTPFAQEEVDFIRMITGTSKR